MANPPTQPNQPMDAQAGFAYLSEQLPVWLAQLTELSTYAHGKTEEFAADYEAWVKEKAKEGTGSSGGRHKRFKSTSMQSLQASVDQAEGPINDSGSRAAAPVPAAPAAPADKNADVDSLRSSQRKRKRPSLLRTFSRDRPQSVQACRRRNLIIQYDSHVQVQLDSMVKAIGMGRNSLRKARNAHQAAQGFSLPSLKRKGGPSAASGLLDSLGAGSSNSNNATTNNNSGSISSSKHGASPAALGLKGSKFTLRSSADEPGARDNDMALFDSVDKQLEAVQGFYETAAYRFLRIGSCQAEFDQAKSQLDALAPEVEKSLQVFKEKAAAAAAAAAAADKKEALEKQAPVPSSTFDPLRFMNNKSGANPLSQLSQTLADMKQQQQQQQQRPVFGPGKAEPGRTEVSTAAPVIEVNDDEESDEESLGELDLSQIQATAAARVGRAF